MHTLIVVLMIKIGEMSFFSSSRLWNCFLVSAELSIGVVTAIAAPASIKVDFEGNGGHAGAVLMPTRYYFLRIRPIIFLHDRVTFFYFEFRVARKRDSEWDNGRLNCGINCMEKKWCRTGCCRVSACCGETRLRIGIHRHRGDRWYVTRSSYLAMITHFHLFSCFGSIHEFSSCRLRLAFILKKRRTLKVSSSCIPER